MYYFVQSLHQNPIAWNIYMQFFLLVSEYYATSQVKTSLYYEFTDH